MHRNFIWENDLFRPRMGAFGSALPNCFGGSKALGQIQMEFVKIFGEFWGNAIAFKPLVQGKSESALIFEHFHNANGMQMDFFFFQFCPCYSFIITENVIENLNHCRRGLSHW